MAHSEKPTYEELLERLVKLEKATLSVSDLPLRALQDKLELDWQPNASLLLPPESITSELLADGVAASTVEPRLHMVRGEVSLAGAVAKGAGFTSARTGLGLYSVTFAPAFASPPSVTLTALNAARVAGSPANILAGSFTASTWTTNTAALLDAAFSFIAIGLR